MKRSLRKRMARRSFSKAAGLFSIGNLWSDRVLEALPQNTNTNSKPSELKIMDMRVATMVRAPMTCPLIRIDSNQGICGLGEGKHGNDRLWS
jgi:hypothetical protein